MTRHTPSMPPQPGGDDGEVLSASLDTSDGVDVVTLGCRLNAYESEVARAHARAAGRENLVIINSCAVTGEAVRQTRQSVRKTRRARPDAHIVVTGCAAQIEPDMFAAMPEVDEVLGNHAKLKAESWRAPGNARVRVEDIMSVRETAGAPIENFGGRARAYLQVQNGCDHRCTFCVIPFGRGNSRSVPIETAAARARALSESGFREIVLTGVDITSWGADLPGRPKLGALVGAILDAAPGVDRLRLSSLDAIEIDPELFDFVAQEPRIAPHLHLSLQAGDDMILKRMKRRHARQDAIDLCARLRAARPDIAFGADLIAGFPTETDAMFENTLALVGECGLAFLHVFPFSPRPNTPAARMPMVDPIVVKERARRLREAGQAALRRHLDAHVGRIQDVLMEKSDYGRLGDFTGVHISNAQAEPGALLRARLTGHDGQSLEGEFIA